MTPEARAGLHALADALPTGSAVPVPREWLLELLDSSSAACQPHYSHAPADLTVADLAKRFGRQTSTLRGWLERGLFPGAYKFMGGREWRVPPAALAEFEAKQRVGEVRRPGSPRRERSDPVDLSAWRRAS